MFLFPILLNAQYSTLSGSFSRSEALGGCLSALTGAESIWGNPAGHFEQESVSLLLSTRQGYSLSGLEQVQAAFAFPLSGVSLAVGLGQFGTEGYREQEAAVAVARQLTPSAAIGLRLGYLARGADETGLRKSFTSRLGFQVHLDDHWMVASSVSQPWMEGVGGGWQAGMAYTPSPSTLWVVEMSGDWGFPPTFRTGAEYGLTNALLFRAGIQLSPSVFTMGFGLSPAQNCRIDVSTAYDLLLGFSPGLGLSWTLPGF